MNQFSILWADDEIDLLKPHILYLTQKGYEVTGVNNGAEALEKFNEINYDIIFLDENMPGISGLEVLSEMKKIKAHVPIIMITKSEEEHIMEEAIGAKITDYLTKPLNSSQILLAVKKVLDNKRIVTEKTNIGYQQDFRNISMAYNDRIDHNEWAEIYKKLSYWEIAIENTAEKSMAEVLEMQKAEANTNFSKFIIENYDQWLNEPKSEKPILSHQLLKKKVLPFIDKDPTFFILIDNLRYDQWKVIEPIVTQYFDVEEESSYYAILPTTTAYARNAIFAGMMPLDISKKLKKYWVGDMDDEGKNLHEEELLQYQLDKNGYKDKKMSYNKIITMQQGKQLLENFSDLEKNDFNAIVFNFVDMLSHARTDMQMIRELAPDEAAYRSITKSWFEHSPLLELLKKIAEGKYKVFITTDHGTIRVMKPFKILGDKNVNSNLRYKNGKNLSYEMGKEVYTVRSPERIGLPKSNVSTSFVFATEHNFFAYPNNFNHYVKYFKDTFQHGGLSMEEMIIPFIHLTPKSNSY